MDIHLDDAPCGLLQLTDDGRIASANTTLHTLLGQPEGTLLGQHVDVLLGSGARIFYQMYLFPMLRVQGRADEVYISLRSQEGEDVPVLLNAKRKEEDGTGISTLAILPMRLRSQLEDELLKARKAAEAADQAKLRFLSMVSHDLRTPLSAIDMAAALMQRGLRGPVTDAQQEDLTRMQEAAQYVLGMVSEMLDFARSQSGQMRVDVVPTSVAPVIKQAGMLVEHHLVEKDLTYAWQADDVQAQADAKKLKQVLVNLLSNAVKFTGAGGHITVACHQHEGRVDISVADTGRGIPADQLAYVFDPFMQVPIEQSSTKQGGVGLGLSISRELARAMGGDLTVESVEGEGATFTLSLQAA